MNGVHDMGGQQGMGPIQFEKNEPVFHAPWEGRVYAINRTLGAWRKWNLDASRHGVELPGKHRITIVAKIELTTKVLWNMVGVRPTTLVGHLSGLPGVLLFCSIFLAF